MKVTFPNYCKKEVPMNRSRRMELFYSPGGSGTLFISIVNSMVWMWLGKTGVSCSKEYCGIYTQQVTFKLIFLMNGNFQGSEGFFLPSSNELFKDC